jgi:hypothetical protein
LVLHSFSRSVCTLPVLFSLLISSSSVLRYRSCSVPSIFPVAKPAASICCWATARVSCSCLSSTVRFTVWSAARIYFQIVLCVVAEGLHFKSRSSLLAVNSVQHDLFISASQLLRLWFGFERESVPGIITRSSVASSEISIFAWYLCGLLQEPVLVYLLSHRIKRLEV